MSSTKQILQSILIDPQAGVTRVSTCGAFSFEQVTTGAKQDTAEVAVQFLCSTLLFHENFDGMKNLLAHPATMTHTSIAVEKRTAVGVLNIFNRSSAELGEVVDLVFDLEQPYQQPVNSVDLFLGSDKKNIAADRKKVKQSPS